MMTTVLPHDKDPMGAAIMDFLQKGRAGKLRVFSSMFDDDEMPVKHLFRELKDMPMLEQKALEMANGRILDVGAGAGCHALELQSEGKAVKAIDISPLSCEAMRLRGVVDVECINLMDNELGGMYDTILLLMNGTGIAGKAERLPLLLDRLKRLMAPGGQILIDSSDLKYVYEDEDGNFDIDADGAYYGEVDYQMVYGKIKGEPFDWLYADFALLASAAASCGLSAELVAEGEHYDYLARIRQA
ncbi:MAG: SAM-dependent methyltransferase [Paludibacteraceae bacterium]|nr:SAM-dependent methyltransferase [Paludibacteraceae bacterium]